MDAIRFIKDRNRMCAKYTPLRCEGCPADSYGKSGEACIMIDTINPEKLVPIVEKWAIKNPPRTRQSEFLKQWPNAKRDCNDILEISPCDIDIISIKNCDANECNKCRRAFWSKEIE